MGSKMLQIVVSVRGFQVHRCFSSWVSRSHSAASRGFKVEIPVRCYRSVFLARLSSLLPAVGRSFSSTSCLWLSFVVSSSCSLFSSSMSPEAFASRFRSSLPMCVLGSCSRYCCRWWFQVEVSMFGSSSKMLSVAAGAFVVWGSSSFGRAWRSFSRGFKISVVVLVMFGLFMSWFVVFLSLWFVVLGRLGQGS